MYYKNENDFKELCGYTIDDVWYPRVTKIVDIKAKPALYKFYAELGSHKAGEEIKKKSADEGTKIHEAFEKILVGEKPEIDPSIAPAIKAAVEFVRKIKFRLIPNLWKKELFIAIIVMPARLIL